MSLFKKREATAGGDNRLPPGQKLTDGWPVLHYGVSASRLQIPVVPSHQTLPTPSVSICVYLWFLRRLRPPASHLRPPQLAPFPQAR